MARRTTPLARPGPRFKELRRALVVCEDLKSSRRYLLDAAHHYRVSRQVDVEHCERTDPPGIVAEAVKRQRSYDELYCVFDRNGHEGFDTALEEASRHQKITVIPSYPCFEFWLLLHFGFTDRPYMPAGNRSACDRVIHTLREKDGMAQYAKGAREPLFARLEPMLPAARRHAEQILARIDDPRNPNPSTHIHELLARLEALAQPEPLPDAPARRRGPTQ